GETGLHVLAGLLFGGGILGLSLILDKILGKDSLGGGDIKLFGVVGLYLGMVGTLFTMLLSAIIGLVFAAVMRLQGSDTKTSSVNASSEDEELGHIPFGPSISLAACGMLLFGQRIVDWYLALLSL
ncbi:MAG: prepilin peptidase, partial [Lachnospiraceae bacterium]|nr:prepilin peptidase [Lachnospiraceae bacterium]